MQDWHLRQELYHKFYSHVPFSDDLSLQEIVEERDEDIIILRALEYPTKQSETLFYPGKSYAVAIIFAKLLEKHFKVDFYEALDDSLLLYKNDPYFQTYRQKKHVYDQIIKDFPFDLILETPHLGSENFQKTCDYFLKEFLLHDETSFLLPS